LPINATFSKKYPPKALPVYYRLCYAVDEKGKRSNSCKLTRMFKPAEQQNKAAENTMKFNWRTPAKIISAALIGR